VEFFGAGTLRWCETGLSSRWEREPQLRGGRLMFVSTGELRCIAATGVANASADGVRSDRQRDAAALDDYVREGALHTVHG
jgi:hypothetical protein